jgi:hypothetical protein
MQVPTIPETGVDSFVLEEINSYTALLIEHIMKYGNNIPHSSRAEYVGTIAKDFQEWYNKHPEVHSIECVKNALSMSKNIPCIEEEQAEEQAEEQEQEQEQIIQSRRRKPRTTLDDDESDSELESDYYQNYANNQPDDYYQ